MDTTLTLRCECGSEHIDIDLYMDFDEEDGYLSFSSKWFGPHRPWRERFRAVWLILRGKSYYFDELIFNRDKVEQLRDFLTENLGDQHRSQAEIRVDPNHSHSWQPVLNDVVNGYICFPCGAIKSADL